MTAPRRLLVTVYLPLDVDTVLKIGGAFAKEFPEACVVPDPNPEVLHIYSGPAQPPAT